MLLTRSGEATHDPTILHTQNESVKHKLCVNVHFNLDNLMLDLYKLSQFSLLI